jgi:N-methylhydantoinase B
MTNTRNTPIEELELSYPVRVLSLEARRASGGSGLHKGGDGLTKRLLFLEPAHASFVGQRQEKGPWGLAGGKPGKKGALYLQTPDADRPIRLAGNWSGRLEAGSILRVDTPGGGGYGRR